MKSLIFGILFAIAGQVYAETVAIPVAQQGEQTAKVPRHGQKMDAVQTEFGDPIDKKAAVGEPPITQWVYNGFTVYFEYDVVIHTVLHPVKK